jgi:hypothetical protein
MANILAARVETQAEAERLVTALRTAGIGPADVTSFYLNPPGRHAEYPIGGDAHHDEGAKHSGKTAAAGAAVGGITGAALGTAVAAATDPGLAAVAGLAGAGVGAYAGSLAGGLSGTRAGDPRKASVEEPVERAAGVMVAVRVDLNENDVLEVLRTHGARDIERTSGEWRDGAWIDFDPRRTSQRV